MDSESLKLTAEQQRAVDAALTGHNVCIFGRAGVGKTTVVERIRKILTSKGKKCQIVCSSGISCDAYDGLASTVHSHYGLQTAELPFPSLLERSLSTNNVVEQIRDVDVLVWDEISMSSVRVFELVNIIHHRLSQNANAFGGIQVLLVGDFWQLKPVRSALDAGRPIYESEIFNTAFPHRIELQNVMRQQASELRLRKALDQLREGNCDEETERYLTSLSRDLSVNDITEDLLHIYFRKLPIEMHNLDVLSKLPGNLLTFESIDTGNSQLLDCPSEKTLTLKPRCKIMLLFNINKSLKNGYQGTFLGVVPGTENEDEKQIHVTFPKVGTVKIGRKTWYKYNTRGNVLATRTQFPVMPSYAMTVHKAQGLTLNRVVVHCSQEFVPGQTYVGLSRVKSEAGLQVINFQKRFLLPLPEKLKSGNISNDSCDKLFQDQDQDHGFSCCKSKTLDDGLLNCVEENHLSHPEEGIEWTNENDGESNAKQLFESCTGVKVNLEDVLLSMMCDFQHSLTMLPERFSVKGFLESVINDKHDDSYTSCIKSAANYAYAHLKVFQLLAHIIWYRLFALFEEYLSGNGEEVHMTNSNFTFATSKLHQLFLTNEYRSDVISAFSASSWSDLNDGQRTLGAQLTFHLFQLFTNALSSLVRKQENGPVLFNVSEMGPDGKGKIRYIGGWAVRKALQKSQR